MQDGNNGNKGESWGAICKEKFYVLSTNFSVNLKLFFFLSLIKKKNFF